MLRTRFYKGSDFCTVWLLEQEGAAECSVLFGQMSKHKAEELMDWAEGLGIYCEVEDSRLPFSSLGTK